MKGCTSSAIDELLAPRYVARWLEVEVSTLAAWRSRGDHPLSYLKIGGRVRYRRADVEAYLQAVRRTNSTEGK